MIPLPHYEQLLQRWAGFLERWKRAITIAAALAGVLALCAATWWGTLVYIGVSRYVPPPPEKSGNVQCWFGADGKSVTCAGVRFVRVE